jgi:hypothetical protein
MMIKGVSMLRTQRHPEAQLQAAAPDALAAQRALQEGREGQRGDGEPA